MITKLTPFALSHSRLRLDEADELAFFLNDLRQNHWTLTSSAYQRKSRDIPLTTAEELLHEQDKHPSLEYNILRHKGQIIAASKVRDKHGDGRVAYGSDLDVHPDFQRSAAVSAELLVPCLRRLCEEGNYQWLELVTWVLNRKGIPLFKRGGYRVVPGTSLLMANFLPLILRHPASRFYLQGQDYLRALVSERSYGYDNMRYQGLDVFRYKWDDRAKGLEVLIDFSRRQIAWMGCAQWSFGAWVVDEDSFIVQVQLDNRSADEMCCWTDGGFDAVIRVPKGKHHQMTVSVLELGTDSENRIAFEVQVDRLQFSFTVQRDKKIWRTEPEAQGA
ncbi:MAG: hypothetical protein F4X75_09325 [Gemmatimonadetes bacterium]|nr:hypothetical protein [Gemmatimonadota bacterium]